MAKSKLITANEKISKGVVGGYKKIEKGVVEGFTKITDKFVDQFLTHEGESVEDAKKRLSDGQALRDNAQREDNKRRATEHEVLTHAASEIGNASVNSSLEIARESVEHSRNAGK